MVGLLRANSVHLLDDVLADVGWKEGRTRKEEEDEGRQEESHHVVSVPLSFCFIRTPSAAPGLKLVDH